MSASTQWAPTLLSSCSRASTAAESRYRIQRPLILTRDTRVIALDPDAAGIVGRIAERPWSGGAHFLTYERGSATRDSEDFDVDAKVHTTSGRETMLSEELDGADVAVMVATDNTGATAASVIGHACAARGIMTAGLVVAGGGVADEAVSALRPHAVVLVRTNDEDDVQEMLSALRV